MRLNLRPVRVALVTGAGSGIGRATAVEFGRDRRTTVLVTDIDEAAAGATAERIQRRGGTAVAHGLDVTDPDAWERLPIPGVPDVLVNNAGIAVGGAFLDHTVDDWHRQLDVNLFGVIHGCRVIGRRMVDRGEGGHIVNIASAGAFTPVPVLPAYCVSKAGVRMLSECLRAELGPHGIGVSAVCPGFINTDIGSSAQVVGIAAADVATGRSTMARLQARLPSQVASPREVAWAVRAAVVLDLPLVPVRPEAWLGLLAPGLARAVTRPFTAERLARLAPFGARAATPRHAELADVRTTERAPAAVGA